MTDNRIVNALRNNGWTVKDINAENVNMTICSPAGEDFVLDVHCTDDKSFVQNMAKITESFDADQHAEQYIPLMGQGGIPDSAEILISDAYDIQSILCRTTSAVQKVYSTIKKEEKINYENSRKNQAKPVSECPMGNIGQQENPDTMQKANNENFQAKGEKSEEDCIKEQDKVQDKDQDKDYDEKQNNEDKNETGKIDVFNGVEIINLNEENKTDNLKKQADNTENDKHDDFYILVSTDINNIDARAYEKFEDARIVMETEYKVAIICTDDSWEKMMSFCNETDACSYANDTVKKWKIFSRDEIFR